MWGTSCGDGLEFNVGAATRDGETELSKVIYGVAWEFGQLVLFCPCPATMIATRTNSLGGSTALPARQKHVSGTSRRHSTCGVFSADEDEQHDGEAEPGPHPANSDEKLCKKRQSLDLISQIMADDDMHDVAAAHRDARREGGGNKRESKRDLESRRSMPHLAEAEARSRDQQRAFASVARTRGSGELDGSRSGRRRHQKSKRSSRHTFDSGSNNAAALHGIDIQGPAQPATSINNREERRHSAVEDSINFDSSRGRRARWNPSISDWEEREAAHDMKNESYRSVASFVDPDANDHGNNSERAEQKDTLDYLPMRSVNNGHRPRPMSANASVQSSATIDPEDEIDEYPQTASELRSLIKKMQSEFHKLRSAKIAAEARADKLETELTQCRQELDGELLRCAGEAERWRAEAEGERARADGLRQRLSKSEKKNANLERMIGDVERDNCHLRRAGRHLGNAALSGSRMDQQQHQHHGGHSLSAQRPMSRSFHPSTESTRRSNSTRRNRKGGIVSSPDKEMMQTKKMPSSWHGTKDHGRMADLASRFSMQLPLPVPNGDGEAKEKFSRSMAQLQRKDTFSQSCYPGRPDTNSRSSRRRKDESPNRHGGGSTKSSRDRLNASDSKLWSRRASSGRATPVVTAPLDGGPSGGTDPSVAIETLTDLNVSSPSLRSSGTKSIGINELEKDEYFDCLDGDSTGESERTLSFDELEDEGGTHDC